MKDHEPAMMNMIPQHSMDFETLIGSPAYLAKQLELRWFYHWELDCNSSPGRHHHHHPPDALLPAAASSMSTNMQHETGEFDVPLNGRLVRKPHHSMPFLRRNIIAHGSGRCDGGRPRNRRRRNKVLILPSDGQDDDTTSKMTVLNSQKIGPLALEAAPRKQTNSGKRKRRAGGRSHDSKNDNKRTATRGNKKTSSLDTNGTNNPHSKHSTEQTVNPLTTFQSFIQSPTVRQQILGKLPAELHHDETFIIDRMKESWLRERRGTNWHHPSGMVDGSGDNNNRVGDRICDSAVTGNKRGKRKASDESKVHLKNNGGSTAVKSERHASSSSEYSTPLKSCSGAASENSSVVLSPKAVFPPQQDGGRSTTQQSQKKQQPPAYFHYLYMQSNNVPATFVEEINDRMCPLCNFDGKSNEGLLRHCGRYHGTLIDTNNDNRHAPIDEEDCAYFEAALGEEGQLHVIVRGVPMRSSMTAPIHQDFMFIQPRSLSTRSSSSSSSSRSAVPKSTSIPFLQRCHHKTASLDTATRNKKLLSLQANDAPASVISAYLPSDTVPLRQYFHARTNLPMSNGEWMEDSDGGDETDDNDAWLHEMSSELLDEFEDVSAREKVFMKLWNRFIKSKHVIADRHVPRKCHEFILEHGKQLREGGLRLNLLLHLFNLWDSGVISSDRILSSMAMFDVEHA